MSSHLLGLEPQDGFKESYTHQNYNNHYKYLVMKIKHALLTGIVLTYHFYRSYSPLLKYKGIHMYI